MLNVGSDLKRDLCDLSLCWMLRIFFQLTSSESRNIFCMARQHTRLSTDSPGSETSSDIEWSAATHSRKPSVSTTFFDTVAIFTSAKEEVMLSFRCVSLFVWKRIIRKKLMEGWYFIKRRLALSFTWLTSWAIPIAPRNLHPTNALVIAVIRRKSPWKKSACFFSFKIIIAVWYCERVCCSGS